MSTKSNRFLALLFYIALFSISLFFLVRLVSLGIAEAILIIPAIDITIIFMRRLYKKQGAGAIKILFNRKSMIVIFMVIPVLISFYSFTEVFEKHFFLFKWKESRSFSIAPSLISTLAAIGLYLSVVIRYRLKLFSNACETIIICLNILFCASFLEIFCGKETWNIPFINITSQTFLVLAILLSWIGMRAIAGFVWIFLFVLAIPRIVGLNIAMGFSGVVYILSAFVSMGLQLKDLNMLTSLKNDFRGAASHIGGDIGASINIVK